MGLSGPLIHVFVLIAARRKVEKRVQSTIILEWEIYNPIFFWELAIWVCLSMGYPQNPNGLSSRSVLNSRFGEASALRQT